MVANYKPKVWPGTFEGIRFENRKRRTQMRLPIVITLVAALLTGCVAVAFPGSPPPSSVQTLALEWFGQMRTGQIARTQLPADYSADLPNDVHQPTDRYLNE